MLTDVPEVGEVGEDPGVGAGVPETGGVAAEVPLFPLDPAPQPTINSAAKIRLLLKPKVWGNNCVNIEMTRMRFSHWNEPLWPELHA
jgi:hypothetical protein